MGTGSIQNWRWWIYQKERFPILAHGILILIFSTATLGFTRQIQSLTGWPEAAEQLAAFISSFVLFFLLRVADEFKDFEEDKKYRSYRPIPRGLVTLNELAIVAFVLAVIQFILTIYTSPDNLLLLILLWSYFLLMSREFFVPVWLKQHLFIYMLSHMLIMAMLVLHISSFQWQQSPLNILQPISLFMMLSYVNGMILEIGRKLRAPSEEEFGVETYSSLWGYRQASMIWLGLILVSAVIAACAASYISRVLLSVFLSSGIFLVILIVVLRFIRRPGSGKAIEQLSAIWLIGSYLHLGMII